MNEEHRNFLIEGEQAGLRYHLGTTRKQLVGPGGLYQGRQAGSSLEFKDHRSYEPGDDLRHIDWNAYARSDQITVKLFHEEVTPHLDLVVDGSRSMALPESEKLRTNLGLAAMLTAAAMNTGFSTRVWLLDNTCRLINNNGDSPQSWDTIPFDFGGDAGQTFLRKPPEWKPRSIRILLSDLLWNCNPQQIMANCADGATAVGVVQILARSDAEPEAAGQVRLVDCETGETREVQVDKEMIQRYHKALSEHQNNWNLAARRVGSIMTGVIAEECVLDWKLDEFVAAELLKIA